MSCYSARAEKYIKDGVPRFSDMDVLLAGRPDFEDDGGFEIKEPALFWDAVSLAMRILEFRYKVRFSTEGDDVFAWFVGLHGTDLFRISDRLQDWSMDESDRISLGDYLEVIADMAATFAGVPRQNGGP